MPGMEQGLLTHFQMIDQKTLCTSLLEIKGSVRWDPESKLEARRTGSCARQGLAAAKPPCR